MTKNADCNIIGISTSSESIHLGLIQYILIIYKTRLICEKNRVRAIKNEIEI